MTNTQDPGFQADLFPELIAHTGQGSGSAMAAMLRQRREVATEPLPLWEESVRGEDPSSLHAAD
jgi:hypothetical protein